VSAVVENRNEESIEMVEGLQGERREKGGESISQLQQKHTAAQFVMTGRAWGTQNAITSTTTTLAPSTRKGRKGGTILKAKSGSGERNEMEMTKEVFLVDIAVCVGYSRIRQLP
jgi:hypothetical protein